MGRADSVLSIAASGLPHLVEGSDTVARFELDDFGPNRVNDTCNVVALIDTWL